MKKEIKNYIIMGVIVVVMLCGFLIYNYIHISNFEKSMLLEQSNIIMNYYDSFNNDEGQGLDKYILFALTYSNNENDKSLLSSKEIKDILENTFNKNFNEDEINHEGITPLLMDNNIMQNYDNKEYYIDKDSINQSKISNINIVIYNNKKIIKRGKRFIVKYDKYVIENPYDILNYYDAKGGYDTSKISSYLRGNGKLKDVKSIIEKDYLDSNTKKVSDEKVIFELKGTKFLINVD